MNKDDILKALREELKNNNADVQVSETLSEELRSAIEELKAQFKPEQKSHGLGLTTGEKEKFSMARAIRGISLGWDSESKFEKEVIGEATQKALSEGNLEYGGFLVPEEVLTEIRDLIRAQSIFGQIPGPRRIPTTSRPLIIPELRQDPTAGWIDEGIDVPETDMKWGFLEFYPKKLAAYIPITSELLRDADEAVETIVRERLAFAMADTIDSGFMYGTGGTYQPIGLWYTDGVGTGVNMGTDGGSANFDTLHKMLAQLEAENLSLESLRWVMNPRTARDLNMIKDADGYYINAENMRISPINTPFIGVPSVQTNKILKNETSGSATTTTSIILGDFRYMWIAEWQGLVLDASREYLWRKDMVAIRAIQRTNCFFEKLKAFNITQGVTSPNNLA